MKRSITFLIIALTFGLLASLLAAVQYRRENTRLLQHVSDTQTRTPPPSPAIPPAPATTDDNNVSIVSQSIGIELDTNTERIQELELALQQRDEELERLRARFRPIEAARREAEEPPQDRRAWLEDLQTEDPERYEQIVRRREEMRQRVNDSFARKAAHFLYRDTGNMDEMEFEEYEHMLGLLSDTWRLAEQMQNPELERSERWEIGREVMANVRELTPMLEAERDREFYELALQLGYDESSAIDFVDYINDMIEVSTFGSIWRGQRGGWGR